MEVAIIRPVIMSGGAGTRLWPLSRKTFPKQLLPVAAEQSMLQATAARVQGSLFSPPLVVAGEEHRFFVKRQLEDAKLKADAIVLEPVGRNTATVAALASVWATAAGANELLLLMPSDHVIRDLGAFLDAIERATPAAQGGKLVTFGVQPDEPNTQYGYIEIGDPDETIGGVHLISRFVEKPDERHAREYVESGRFAWNSGIFLFTASAMLEEMRRHLPESLDAISRSMESPERDGIFIRPEPNSFAAAQNISIDHGIMERTDRGVVVPVGMGWSDVGSWEALWKISPRDPHNNAVQGEVVALDCQNSLVRSHDGGLVTAIGLDGMAVIAVRDAIFVSPLDRAADVKLLVDQLEDQGRDYVASPAKVARPWGSYETLGEGLRFQIKRIIVDPGERLSLQRHFHRSEHWVVVRGTAEVTVGDTISLLQENQSTYIPAGTTHRLGNPGKVPVELIEVQCGPYLGEDDIVRLDDEYGRS
jgi:mannose-1-phosphate guanylyltransferase/mannose-6-phosphate isomerase